MNKTMRQFTLRNHKVSVEMPADIAGMIEIGVNEETLVAFYCQYYIFRQAVAGEIDKLIKVGKAVPAEWSLCTPGSLPAYASGKRASKGTPSKEDIANAKVLWAMKDEPLQVALEKLNRWLSEPLSFEALNDGDSDPEELLAIAFMQRRLAIAADSSDILKA